MTYSVLRRDTLLETCEIARKLHESHSYKTRHWSVSFQSNPVTGTKPRKRSDRLCSAVLWWQAAQKPGGEQQRREAISGDLDERPSATLFPLGTGMNTFSGRLGAATGFGDFDSIAFSIPAGAFVTGISYSILTTLLPDTGSSFFLVEGNMPPDPSLGQISVVAMASGTLTEGNAFGAVLPLPAGAYGLSHSGMSFGTGEVREGGGFFQDYKWTFTVESAPSPVPEPTTAILLATGAVVVGRKAWVRRGCSRSGRCSAA